jgi:hypothetical protein
MKDHFDRDDSLFRATGALRCPITSSSLYLNGVGHLTAIHQITEKDMPPVVTRPPQKTVFVPLKPNRCTILKGTLFRGFSPCPQMLLATDQINLRRLLAVNWWDRKPG